MGILFDIKLFIIRVIIGVLFFLPISVYALGNPDTYNAQTIVPCAGVNSEGNLPACGWCSLVQLLSNLINYSIYLAVVLSSLVFAYAGFLYLTNNGNEHNIKKATGIFKTSVYGIIGILVAWLIVNAIMTKIATGLLGTGDWNSLQCKELDTDTQPIWYQGINGGNGYPGADYDPS